MTTFVPETVRRRHQYRAVSPTTNGACENCGGLPGEASDFCEWPVVSPDEPLRRIAAYLSARDKAAADDGATPDQHEERWQACEAARLAMFALLDTAPVASLAPTGDLAELIGELHDAADEVMCNEAPVYQRAARLMHDAALRFRFWPSSLAPTPSTALPEGTRGQFELEAAFEGVKAELEGMLPRLREAEVYPYTEQQHRRRFGRSKVPLKVPILLNLAEVEYVLRSLAAPSSLAPTSLAEIPECVEAAYRAVLHLPFVDQLAMKQALRAAEAARPPKGA